MTKKILVIGSLNMDLVVDMEELPKKGETVHGSKITSIPGGKGANQAASIGRLGGRVKLLGCIGKDNFARIQKESLQAFQVDIKDIKEIETKPTGTAIIYVNRKGENSIVVVASANEDCTVEYIKAQDNNLKESDYILLQMEIPQDVIGYTIKRAKELQKIVLLNPAPAPEKIPSYLYQAIDFLIPNETELAKLTKLESLEMESLKKGVKTLLTKGVKNVIVTMGERGALLGTEKGFLYFPAEKVKAVDTTAAGDCFIGAFVTSLAEGREVEDAIVFANLSSSIAVTKKGAQSSIPSRDEVEKLFLKKLIGANL